MKSELRNLFDQGDLPVKIENRGIGRKLTWNVRIAFSPSVVVFGSCYSIVHSLFLQKILLISLCIQVDVESISFQQYLPIFFTGLVEKQDPYRFVAFEGIFELLETSSRTEKVLPCLPQVIQFYVLNKLK